MPEHTIHRVTIQLSSGAPNCKTQCGKIFALILSRYPGRVPLYEIFPLAKQYNARIFSLRRWLWPKGFDIDCEDEWVDGQCHTWYRLGCTVPEPTKPETLKVETPRQDRPRSTGLPLFDLAVRS